MSQLDSPSVAIPIAALAGASALAGELLTSPREGLLLSAPQLVERRTPDWRLPVLVAQRGTADDLDRYVLDERGFLVFLDDDSGATRIAPLMPRHEPPRLALRVLGERPDPLRALPAARVSPIDAARLLTFPRVRTTGALVVVIGDQRSNAARLMLEGISELGELGEPSPPSVAEVIPDRLPARRTHASTPPVGVVLRVERYAVRRDGSALTLRCTFRLPIAAARPTGMVVTLIATGAVSPAPRAVAFTVEPRTEGAEVLGDVEVDLFETALCESPDTWFIHAFVEGHTGGPATTTVVREVD